jgi:hypothetical protein
MVCLLLRLGRKKAPRLPHAPGDGGFGDAKRIRRLGVAHVFARNEHDCGAQGGVEPRKSARKPGASVKIASIGRGREQREHAEMLGKPRDRAAAAMPIAASIDNDAGEPSRELCISFEGVDLLDQLAADILRDVFSVDDRTREPPRQAMDAIVVTPQQALEGVAISRRSESGEFAIGAGAWLGAGRAGRAVAALDCAI